MNKIIPFNKDIKFDDNIGEITSIALDDTLKFKDSYTISGDLIVRGCHKYHDLETDFSYPIPTSITVDNKYDTTKTKISIDDFYYEIINDDTLRVKIDLILDNLLFKEKEIEPISESIEYDRNDSLEKDDIINDNVISKKVTEDQDQFINEEEKDVTELLNENSVDKEYSIYRVYIVVEGDTLSKILEKYNITSEELGHYNDLNNIKPGMKLIIPSIDE